MAAIRMSVLRGASKSSRNHNPHVLINRYCAGKYQKDQRIARGYAFSRILSYESSLSSICFWGHRSLCLQAGEVNEKRENKPAFPNQKLHRTGIDMSNGNKGEVAFDEFLEYDSEDDSVEIADDSQSVEECKRPVSPLFKVLMEAPPSRVNDVLEKWVEEGNILDRGEVTVTRINLQRRRLYGKALQFLEWLESTKCLNFVEHDYALHLELIAKVHGLQRAEKFINEIPESFRGEVIYQTFLANCVSALNVKKAEEAFNTIKDIGLPITTYSCDQLLLLYKSVDKKKVIDVLSIMEKESIKPSIFTYRILIDLKGCSFDIEGMEQIVEKMKAEGMEPDLIIQDMIVQFYIFGGLNDKAEAILKKMEGNDIKEKPDACKFLLRHYSSLNKATNVARIWNVCEAKPRLDESLEAIEAFGKIGNVEKAEEIFEKILKSKDTVSSKFYDALLRVYANHKLLFEGEDLLKRMKEKGYMIGPMTCDVLVKLYIEAGEVEKADRILLEAEKNNTIRPLHRCYIASLNEYSRRGDIQNTEKIFHKLRQSGFRNRMKMYQLLLEAYLNAKSPAFGFRERMRADNIFPNKKIAKKLAAVDALCKSQVAELEEEFDAELGSICSKGLKSSSPSVYECWLPSKSEK